MSKDDWQDDIRPFDEHEGTRRSSRERDEWDELDDEEEERDPNLDPGFSSWSDYYNYMYG